MLAPGAQKSTLIHSAPPVMKSATAQATRMTTKWQIVLTKPAVTGYVASSQRRPVRDASCGGGRFDGLRFKKGSSFTRRR